MYPRPCQNYFPVASLGVHNRLFRQITSGGSSPLSQPKFASDMLVVQTIEQVR